LRPKSLFVQGQKGTSTKFYSLETNSVQLEHPVQLHQYSIKPLKKGKRRYTMENVI